MAEEKYDAKSLKMYMKVASNAEDVSPIAAYYLVSYTATKAVDLLKTQRTQGQEDPELSKDVQAWFQKLDELKSIVGSELQDRESCKKAYYEYAYSVFLKADNKYRDDNYSVQLAQEFYNATVLLDGYSIFGPATAEVATHKKYSKVARLKIMKAIKSGNLPVPKSSQQPVETDIPDEVVKGVNGLGNFKPNESLINRGSPNKTNTGYNDPPNPYGNFNPTNPNNFDAGTFGQGANNGLPDFTRFDNSKSEPINSFGQEANNGLPDFTKFNNGGTTPYVDLNLGVGGYSGVGSFGLGGIPSSGPTGGTHNVPVVQPEKARSRPRRGPDFYQKAGKAQDFCKRAVSELEYKRLRQFKENLLSALELLEEIDPEGN